MTRGTAAAAMASAIDDRRSVASGRSSNDGRSTLLNNPTTAGTLTTGDSQAFSSTPARTGTGQLRKFTAGVGGRPGMAREARENAKQLVAVHNPLRTAPLASPLDYERFVSEKATLLENDAQRDILLFPRDDLQEIRVPPLEERLDPDDFERWSVDPDAKRERWSLTDAALGHYAGKECGAIVFNYAGQAGGDYNQLDGWSAAASELSLSSLVFESDLQRDEILDAAAAAAASCVGELREGILTVVKADQKLLDNFKSDKRRHCVLRRDAHGVLSLEVYKGSAAGTGGAGATSSGGSEQIRILSAALTHTKKGKTLLEVETESGERRHFADDDRDDGTLAEWAEHINTTLALGRREESLQITEKQAPSQLTTITAASAPSIDAGSTGSSGSGSRGGSSSVGRNSAARAIQPPVVERRNLFLLYPHMAPLPSLRDDPSALLPSRLRFASKSSAATAAATPQASPSVFRCTIQISTLDLRLPVSPTHVEQIEPFFVRAFLWDARSSRRLTEEWRVQTSDDDRLGLLGNAGRRRPSFAHIGLTDVQKHVMDATRVRTALCSLALQPHPEVYVVVVLDRLLAVDASTTDLYMKTSGDVKATLKLQKVVHTAAHRLSHPHATHFAWTAKLDDLRDERHGGRLSEADLQKWLTDYAKFERTTKSLVPGASIRIAVDAGFGQAIGSPVPYRILPAWTAMAGGEGVQGLGGAAKSPTRNGSSVGGGGDGPDEPPTPLLEIQSFGDVAAQPYSSLTNLLYVYPLSLKYDNQRSFGRARNIACSVQFVRGGLMNATKRAILDRQALDGPFVTTKTCAVQHHQQAPVFCDEVKMRLPLALDSSDHLLFTFHHVSVSSVLHAKGDAPTSASSSGSAGLKGSGGGDGASATTDTIVGYAWLPLVRATSAATTRLQLNEDEEEFALLVAEDLPSAYYTHQPFPPRSEGPSSSSASANAATAAALSGSVSSSTSSAATLSGTVSSAGGAGTIERSGAVKWVDASKPLFRVRLRLVSSALTSDARLQQFFETGQRLLTLIKKARQDEDAANNTSAAAERSCSPAASTAATSTARRHLARGVEQMKVSTSRLLEVDVHRLVGWMPVLLTRLVRLIGATASGGGGGGDEEAIVDQDAEVDDDEERALARLAKQLTMALCVLADRCALAVDRTLLRIWVRKQLRATLEVERQQPLHATVARNVAEMLSSADTPTAEAAILLRQLGLLVDVIVKSMAEKVLHHSLYKAARAQRFSPSVLAVLERLVDATATCVVRRHRELPTETRTANTALAFLLRFALSLADRGAGLRWAHAVSRLYDSSDSRALRDYKLDILCVLLRHEHLLPLSLPLLFDRYGQPLSVTLHGAAYDPPSARDGALDTGTTPTATGLWSRFLQMLQPSCPPAVDVEGQRYASCAADLRVSQDWTSRHVLPGLLMHELVAALREPREHRRRAIALLRNTLAKHASDRRLADRATQRRVALLWAPVLSLLVEHMHELEAAAAAQLAAHQRDSPSSHAAPTPLAIRTTTTTNAPNIRVDGGTPDGTLTTSVQPQQEQGHQKQHHHQPFAEKLDTTETQDLLLCALYVLDGLPRAARGHLITDDEAAPMLLRLLQLIASLFLYRGRRYTLKRLEHHLRATSSTSTAARKVPTTSPAGRVGGGGKQFVFGVQHENAATGNGSNPDEAAALFAVVQTQQLAEQAALVLLDTAQSFAQQLAYRSSNPYYGGVAVASSSATKTPTQRQQVPVTSTPTTSRAGGARVGVPKTTPPPPPTVASTKSGNTLSTSEGGGGGGLADNNALFERILTVQAGFLTPDWPESARLHAVASLAVSVKLFASRLFDTGPLDGLSALLESVLAQLDSRLPSVQRAAAALLHLLLKYGHDANEKTKAVLKSSSSYGTNSSTSSTTAAAAAAAARVNSPAVILGRPGAQMGVALARLLGRARRATDLSAARFERGLELLAGFSPAPSPGSGNTSTSVFDAAVHELVEQLRGVLAATSALKTAQDDPTRLAELHVRLADSYRGSAALRVAWLETAAQAPKTEPAERALCQAHATAIAAQELARKGEIQMDWRPFAAVSQAIQREEETRGETQQPAGFTFENLLTKVETTARFLVDAERYEAVGPLYRLILPALEQRRQWKTLAGVYTELQQAASRAAEVAISGRRHLAVYFRVRFYGPKHFGEEHNTEWVYREPGCTSLAEAAERLAVATRRRLRHDRVAVEPADNEADEELARRNPDVAYVFVTHVEPEKKESEGGDDGGDDAETRSDYEVHTNVNKFVYESVVLEGGPAAAAAAAGASNERPGKPESVESASLSRRALLRTTIETGGTFPTTRRRLRVTGRKTARLSPLDFACARLGDKTRQLEKALAAPPHLVDLKRLHLLLQGTVLPTVNAGPLAYAEAFTQPTQKARYGPSGVARLRDSFRRLMAVCERALRVNEQLVGADQAEYHAVMAASADAMHERLDGYFGESLRSSTFLSAQAESAAGRRESAATSTGEFGGEADPLHVLDAIGGL